MSRKKNLDFILGYVCAHQLKHEQPTPKNQILLNKYFFLNTTNRIHVSTTFQYVFWRIRIGIDRMNKIMFLVDSIIPLRFYYNRRRIEDNKFASAQKTENCFFFLSFFVCQFSLIVSKRKICCAFVDMQTNRSKLIKINFKTWWIWFISF